jgi:hypothetical protein
MLFNVTLCWLYLFNLQINKKPDVACLVFYYIIYTTIKTTHFHDYGDIKTELR